MRRILVEAARARASAMRGGRIARVQHSTAVDFDAMPATRPDRAAELCALEDALDALARMPSPALKTQQIMMSPDEMEGDAFRAEKLRLWSDARYMIRGTFRPFDLHPDGKRFAIAPAALEADGEARSRHDDLQTSSTSCAESRRIDEPRNVHQPIRAVRSDGAVQGDAAMKLLVAYVSVLVSLGIAQSAAVAQTRNRSSDEAAIRVAITAMTDAFNAQDPKAWVRLCTADAQLVTARGEVMDGVAEIEKGLTTLFRLRNRAARARTLDATVRFITDDVALAHVTNELAGVLGPDSQTQPPQRELSLRVFVKDRAGWRLTAFHNTTLQR